jgi:16S rRNA (cytidine1402-2'-O)-methyltransferase
VLDTLRSADAIACEDTRRTRILLDHYEIAGPLVSYHEHNERARTKQLLVRIESGDTVVLVSDAGTPVVSDPWYALVQACISAGLPLEVLPGASSVVTAVVASGLPAERWRFVGFLPRKRGELERILGGASDTLVAFESPGRLLTTLDLLAGIDAERPVCVCRELTKLHEEVRRDGAASLAVHYREHPPRGEIVLVVGGATPGRADHEEALAALRTLIEAGARTRPAAGVVAQLTGLGVNDLYRAITES